jgi:hypothetical protein
LLVVAAIMSYTLSEKNFNIFYYFIVLVIDLFIVFVYFISFYFI